MAARTRKTQPKKDHEEQAIDTDLPTDFVNEEAWAAMVAEYEGDPE